MSDPGAILRDQVLVLVAVEKAIEEAIDLQSDLTLPYAELHVSLRAVQSQSIAQRLSLQEYLGEALVEAGLTPSPITTLLAQSSLSGTVAHLLSADCAAFNFAANEYSVLAELSLRLHEPALRELAPKHLASYAGAVRQLTHLLPGVVVAELDREGAGCRCICPMCSIGVCGCTAAGRNWIEEAWGEARPQVDSEPGLSISTPRRGSGLADNGVRGGDRLLRVDGQSITSFVDVQKAIRKHEIGGELVMRIAHGSEAPRDIKVTHVSDYPAAARP